MVSDAPKEIAEDCAALPLDNGVKVRDCPSEAAPAALDFLSPNKMGETMTAETVNQPQSNKHVGLWGTGYGAELEAAPRAEYVTQQMMELAAKIEGLLQEVEATQLRARQLRERWSLARQQLQRSYPVQQPGMSAAAYERALATWQERMTQTQRAMIADETLLHNQLQHGRDELASAQQAFKALQDEDLPAAQLHDAQQGMAQLTQQQKSLERDLDALHAELRTQELRKQALDAVQTRPGAKTNEVQNPSTNLGSAANSNDDDLTQSVAELSQQQREDLAPIVQLVGGVLQSQRGGPRSKLTGGTVPFGAATAVLQSSWGNHISKMDANGWMDVNQLIQWVMREAYVNNTEDLRGHAYKVKHITDFKRVIRDELVKARAHLKKEQGKPDFEPFAKSTYDIEPEVDPRTGALTVKGRKPDGFATDSEALADYVKYLEELQNTAGGDAQMAQADLQNVTQKQQQMLQTLSNLSKVLHETSMAIIRKIGS